jgi:hypothetical protein
MRAMRIRGLAVLLNVIVLGGACSDTAVDELENACNDYCTLVMRNCQGAVAQYPDLSTCMSTCQTMPIGTDGQRDGNNIECRTFWAAISEGNMGECVKAGPGGAGVCGSNCESFCASTLEICSDQPVPPYNSAAECMSACNGYSMTEVFDASDISGDTFACRLYHMTAASTDANTHCQHTGVDSAVCI